MHDDRHEQGCAALARGEGAELEPALAEELARCAQCEVRVRELKAFLHELDAAAREEREVLAQAREQHAAELEADVVARLREHVGAGKARRARPLRWVLVAALAAAGVALAVLLRDDPPATQQPLLGEAPRELELSLDGASQTVITWRAIKSAQWYTVGLYRLDGTPIDVDPQRRFSTTRWELPAQARASWPPEVLCRVNAFDGASNHIGTIEARAARP